MATEQEKAFLGEIDFTKIILYQIFELTKALNEGDIEGGLRRAEILHILMSNHWDEEYLKKRQKINQDINAKIKALSNPGDPNSSEKISKLEVLRAKKMMELVIKLIGGSGFLPPKKVFGVITAYRPEQIEKDVEKISKEVEGEK